MTHTIAISQAALYEIADELIRAGCEDAVVLEDDHSISLNMNGLVLIRKAENVLNFPIAADPEKSELLRGLE